MNSVRRASPRCGSVALLLASVVMIGGAASADIVIDDFTDIGSPSSWPVTQSGIGNIIVTEIGLHAVLGMVRQTAVFGDGFDAIGDDVTVDIDPVAGILDFDTTFGADGATTLIYTGFPFGLNADFSNEQGINVVFQNFGPHIRGGNGQLDTPITIDLFDGDGMARGVETIVTSGPQTVVFNFNDFTGIQQLDKSDINRITVTIDPEISIDFELDLIATTAIPAPGAIALLGLAGLCSRRRRRRA